MISPRRFYWSLGLALLLGATLGWFIRISYAARQPGRLIEIRENDENYHYINPLLLVDSPRQAPEYDQLKNSIATYIDQAISKNQASDISAYFRDVNTAKWTGVNENALYDPSSMMKVAMMIGYLKEAEVNPNILSEHLSYQRVLDPGQHYPPEHPLASGSYSVHDLILTMIIESDNAALSTLYNHNHQGFVNVFKDLELAPPPTITTTDFMSPRTYSSIFRILYSSTYLPRNVSEQALQLLTYTTFTKGLVASLPKGTIVAHKFGEHTSIDGQGQVISHQLHDCGIIYYPAHPYFLCVMTQGQNFDQLEKVISDLSQLVYQKINQSTI